MHHLIFSSALCSAVYDFYHKTFLDISEATLENPAQPNISLSLSFSNRSEMSLVQVGRFRFKNFDFVHILMVSASLRK